MIYIIKSYTCTSDVEGCNEDQVSYYPDTCSLTPIPGDNLIYATQNRQVMQLKLTVNL